MCDPFYKVKSVLGCDPPSLEGLLGGALPTGMLEQHSNPSSRHLVVNILLFVESCLFHILALRVESLFSILLFF